MRHQRNHQLIELLEKLLYLAKENFMADDTKLEAAIAQLSTDATKLIAEKQGADSAAQAQLDKATTAVEAVDATIVAAS